MFHFLSVFLLILHSLCLYRAPCSIAKTQRPFQVSFFWLDPSSYQGSSQSPHPLLASYLIWLGTFASSSIKASLWFWGSEANNYCSFANHDNLKSVDYLRISIVIYLHFLSSVINAFVNIHFHSLMVFLGMEAKVAHSV